MIDAHRPPRQVSKVPSDSAADLERERLLEHVETDHAIIANPDLALDDRCVEALRDELVDHPAAAVVAAALVTAPPDVRVNAYGHGSRRIISAFAPIAGAMGGLSGESQGRRQGSGDPVRRPIGRPVRSQLQAVAGDDSGTVVSAQLLLVRRGRRPLDPAPTRRFQSAILPMGVATHLWSSSVGQRSA